METKLIQLYCHICQLCKYTTIAEVMQRLSNNCRPKFTDEEVILCYIWGVLNGKSSVKDVYRFICDYWHGWFPLLPGYHAFNHRINTLSDVLPKLLSCTIGQLPLDPQITSHLLDSLPITVAKSQRSGFATSAKPFCDKGYCASKGEYYYGVKLHFIGQSRSHSLPLPVAVCLSPASSGDITVAKLWLQDGFYNIDVFADKAYADKMWHAQLKNMRNISIFTPVKLAKGQQFLDSADNLWNRAVSSVRQPVEAFFNWLNEKVKIQCASKVRSEKSLFVHVFGKFLAACFALIFNF